MRGPAIGSSMRQQPRHWRARASSRRASASCPASARSGPAASDRVKARWARTARYVTALERVRWQGRSLEGLIRELTPVVLAARLRGPQRTSRISARANGEPRCSGPRPSGPPPARCSREPSTAACATPSRPRFGSSPVSPTRIQHRRSRAPAVRVHRFEVRRWIQGRPCPAGTTRTRSSSESVETSPLRPGRRWLRPSRKPCGSVLSTCCIGTRAKRWARGWRIQPGCSEAGPDTRPRACRHAPMGAWRRTSGCGRPVAGSSSCHAGHAGRITRWRRAAARVGPGGRDGGMGSAG